MKKKDSGCGCSMKTFRRNYNEEDLDGKKRKSKKIRKSLKKSKRRSKRRSKKRSKRRR